MTKKNRNKSVEPTESLPETPHRENPDKRKPHPDDPNEEKGPPNKEMPIKASTRIENIF